MSLATASSRCSRLTPIGSLSAAAVCTVSSTVSWLSMRSSWNTKPTRRRGSPRWRPLTSMRPLTCAGSTKPATTESSDVLPEPEGPISAFSVPARKHAVTPASTTRSTGLELPPSLTRGTYLRSRNASSTGSTVPPSSLSSFRGSRYMSKLRSLLSDTWKARASDEAGATCAARSPPPSYAAAGPSCLRALAAASPLAAASLIPALQCPPGDYEAGDR
mmetsp:Transcript_43610/g.111484  ORF Transcript_43610/g.111484 Transcript_43610/m.111484 type:complete len:218 (-) Transcript_43610:146-799(-)